MKMKLSIPNKRLQIDRAQSTAIMVLSIAVIVSIFSLISTKRLWTQAAFQRHVISARRQSAKALQNDVTAAGQLINNYTTVFINSSKADNVIGGRNTTSQRVNPPDGDNARIILDALPSNYDFPALISSVSNILTRDGIASPGISGSDQSATTSDAPTGNPTPVAIQLSINANGSYSSVRQVILDLERSIRPFDVTNLQVSGSNANMTLSLNVKTYFQPATTLTINTKVVH